MVTLGSVVLGVLALFANQASCFYEDFDQSAIAFSKSSSTHPGPNDFVVSKKPIPGLITYQTIKAATEAIWQKGSMQWLMQTDFAGVYEETLFFNRSGITVFRGYTDFPDDPTRNQVVIRNDIAVNTQEGDRPNSESATFHSRADYLRMYNIDLTNVYGKTRDYASLGFAIGHRGYAGFYGCSILGNQDTLDLNSQTNVFIYNSIVSGSIDFIWGSGSGYFLNSTIVPNTAKGAITAHKRLSGNAPGGLVFDKCQVRAEPGVPAASVFLGRPYSQFARVLFIASYLDASIDPAGWTIWSPSSPQTQHVLFGEYQNYGPGAGTRSTRAPFSQEMTVRHLAAFQLERFFKAHGISWINVSQLKVPPFNTRKPGTLVPIERD
ncbi:protein of unknown function [Taphrina deformans PYCC 5710]|uniref:pectinesterase n=1 Tax=Taphrina deformans (strain PYCC 5710 / ATCC 11124 / CBS 356.35 / IMI 108563 / JCM 9778 / NBRC 8474) TaxID=1097556 RepID=R4XEQ6_TAPDE|nr:protein of unknown function [Taphrina deformans PYCC 5710]|eukprot:CCG84128.1 protein of unknown function [Taphrina deformans PYCC 5710]